MFIKKALVIEDIEDNMKLITFILKKNGYSTVEAGSGRLGIELAISEKPNFIILDIQLPDMHGIDVLKEIRKTEIGGKISIIAMTSHAMSGDKEKILEAGCNGYIEKPIDPLIVMNQIREVIEDRP